MNEFQIFTHPVFGEVRATVIDGKLYLSGLDVARALGYSNERNAINRHCRYALKRGVGVQTGTKADGTPAIKQIEMIFIPEGDVYRLTARSKLEGAEKFESWIFDDVVPKVLSTGSYSISGDGVPKLATPPIVPLGALVRLLEFQERAMRGRGCDYHEISAMAKGLMESYGVPVTKAFANNINPQLSLFDIPGEMVPQLAG